jgi:hypothetical protein
MVFLSSPPRYDRRFPHGASSRLRCEEQVHVPSLAQAAPTPTIVHERAFVNLFITRAGPNIHNFTISVHSSREGSLCRGRWRGLRPYRFVVAIRCWLKNQEDHTDTWLLYRKCCIKSSSLVPCVEFSLDCNSQYLWRINVLQVLSIVVIVCPDRFEFHRPSTTTWPTESMSYDGQQILQCFSSIEQSS